MQALVGPLAARVAAAGGRRRQGFSHHKRGNALLHYLQGPKSSSQSSACIRGAVCG